MQYAANQINKKIDHAIETVSADDIALEVIKSSEFSVEEIQNNYIPNPEFRDNLLGFCLERGLKAQVVNNHAPLIHRIISAITLQFGKAAIDYMRDREPVALINTIMRCVKDNAVPDGFDCHIANYGGKLTYIPSIHNLRRQYAQTRPNCHLHTVPWSKKLWQEWRKKAKNKLFPKADEYPLIENDDEALALMRHMRGSEGYELLFIQVVRTTIIDGKAIKECRNYMAKDLYIRADVAAKLKSQKDKYKGKPEFFKPKGPWFGSERLTDVNEMFAKTALKHFIKEDMGATDSDNEGKND